MAQGRMNGAPNETWTHLCRFASPACKQLHQQRCPILRCSNDEYHHHHHDVVLVTRIFLTLSCHFSLSSIASGRSSGQHPVSSHSCWMYVRAGRPCFCTAMCGGQQEYITYEFVPASPAVSCIKTKQPMMNIIIY